MLKKEGLISKIIGIAILVVIIVVVVVLKNKDSFNNEGEPIYGAIGGGKEDLLGDEEINKIFAEKYDFKLVQDSWSNGKTVKDPVLRKDGSMYDLIFFSDFRFFDEYRKGNQPGQTVAERYPVLEGDITLNTPIVIYSWDTVVDKLMEQGIVTKQGETYFITGMEKLMNYILEGKKWSDIGLDTIYGSINIGSVDPVSSSPGATYYGLLLSILTKNDNSEEAINKALPKLKEFYQKSGYMNNTPADLFSMFLKTGMGAKPMIVDYEKSVIDFANSNQNGWNQVKNKIRILYPTPTVMNSHCIAALTDNGKKLIQGFRDEEVSKRTWETYGFRVGVAGSADVSKLKNIDNIPTNIDSVVSGLNIETYDKVINYLKEK